MVLGVQSDTEAGCLMEDLS